MSKQLLFDEVGPWTEIKQEIIRKYAAAYSSVLASQRVHLEHSYVDAFSGPGVQISKATGTITAGSPMIALEVKPPFTDYYFIDLDGDRVEHLRRLVGARSNVHVFEGDCNEVVLRRVFPKIRYDDYKRGLCLLDPKGLHLKWKPIAEAGRMRSIELFLNFPVMDMNRNVFWKNPDGVDPGDIERMTALWGDDTWRQVAYQEERDLFGPKTTKAPIEAVAEAFRKRLKEVAGFSYVPTALPMKNTKGLVIYYLFFASHNKTGNRIASDVFRKYRERER